MPVSNTQAIVAAGIGDGIVSVAGEVIAQPGGGTQWLNDSTIIYQVKIADVPVEAYALETYNIITKEKRLVDSRGATILRAKNNVWAAQLLSTPRDIIRISTGATISADWVLWSVGEDGTILVGDGEHTTLSVFNKDGSFVRKVINVIPYLEAFNVTQADVFWVTPEHRLYWRANELNLHAPGGTFQYFHKDKDLWFTYQSFAKSYAQNFKGDEWFEFGEPNMAYNPCGAFRDNKFIFYYSLTAGERPQDIKKVEFSNEPIELEPLPSYSRPIAFCPYYSYSGQYGVTDDYVGNIVFPDRVELNEATSEALMMNGLNYSSMYLNRTLYYHFHFQEFNDEAQQEYEKWYKEKPEKPAVVYLDGRHWPATLPSWINTRITWPNIQMYRIPGEDFASFRRSIKETLDIVSAYKLPLALTIDCRGKQIPMDMLMEAMPFYDEIIRNYKVVLVMPFDDMRSGMNFYPELKRAMKRIFYAIPGRPNRFHYWLSQNWKQDLKAKLDYEIIALHPTEIDYLKGLIK